ncbi:MAG: SLC13 family permease [Planctomycetota bacterium]|jgi:di/tricarboxylate transporter
MDFQAWVALATLVAAVVLFVTKWLPMEATALTIPVVLSATGVLERADALSGFGNQAVIAIGAIFILGAALRESGVATLMARGIERLAGRSQTRAIVIIMIAVCVLSSFMSSAATVAVFLPAVSVLARRTQVPSSRLMMPLAYAAVLGGTLTLIGTTPNLILGADLADRTGTGLGIFEFTKVGAPVAALGIAYMATFGARSLPDRPDQARLGEANVPEGVAENYGFTSNLYRMRVVGQSGIANKTIADAGVRAKYDMDIVLVHRPTPLGVNYIHPRPDLVLQPEDQLYMEGEAEDAWRIADEELLQFGVAGPRSLKRILGRGLTLAEVTLTPHSLVLGKTFKDLDFQKTWGCNVISVWRGGEVVTAGTGDIALELGDSFMVSGPRDRVRLLAKDLSYVVMTDDSRIEDVRRAPLAALLMLAAVLPPIFDFMPLALSALGAALLMIGTGCISLRGARHSVDWRVLFMIIGTIPLGIALEKTGLSVYAANGILALRGYGGEAMILFCLFTLSSILAVMVNNGAAAVVLAPIAALAAEEMGFTINVAFLAVAIGASCAFVLPFGNQCCLMVMGPGGYSTRDYVKAGIGITIVMTVSTIALLMLLY